MTDDEKLKDAEKKSAEALRRLAKALVKDDEKPGCWAVVITATVVLGLAFPLALLRGWVAVKLWQWFGAPIWPGVHLTIYTVVGLMFLSVMFRHHDFKSDPDASLTKAWGNLIAGVIWPLALLGTAWIWTWLAWGQ